MTTNQKKGALSIFQHIVVNITTKAIVGKNGGVLSQAENSSKVRNISSNEGNDQDNGGQSQKKQSK